MKNKVLCLIGATLVAACAHAQSMPHHHDDGEKLGAVSFPNSCAAQSQKPILRGVALLHSFGYTEAQMQFEAIAKEDRKSVV